MKKWFNLLFLIVLVITGAIYYYIALPAVNIHSPGLWLFVLTLIAFLIAAYALVNFKDINKFIVKYSLILLVALTAVFLIGTLLSSPVINAAKYHSLINIKERNFSEDIKQISYTEIPVLDKDSAEKLGLRKMGSMVDMVSQFEVNNMYTQINYNETPTRVSPLDYGNMFKWIMNRSNGIPAYMRIDMTTQDVECVKLEDGIKYSFSEPLGRNVNRYLRFNYPTYIFDIINFEIDDNGVPYWICPVRDYTIGLFGGIKIQKAILLNAITGELTEYDINDVPQWVDKVYSAEILLSYYNYYGSLMNGYLNSIMAQKGCLKTTEGYNYIALEDDVWVYTGVTSVSGDQSNVGFVLMNQRTAETRYYPISGAEEFSAMASAEGQVQNLGYKATFPLLLNIAGEPTYFIALKDNAGLVKCYAMVNIEKYQIVAIGDSIDACERSYIALLESSGISPTNAAEVYETSGTVASLKEIIINGNTHYFITLDGEHILYDINVAENLAAINLAVGSGTAIQYTESDEKDNLRTVVKTVPAVR